MNVHSSQTHVGGFHLYSINEILIVLCVRENDCRFFKTKTPVNLIEENITLGGYTLCAPTKRKMFQERLVKIFNRRIMN